jgi:cytochrome bd-type quinol oxidase subunit 2
MISITELLLVFCLIIVSMWVIALVDILRNDFKGNDKLVWLIVVIFLPVIGAICYFIIGKKQKISGNKGVGTS